ERFDTLCLLKPSGILPAVVKALRDLNDERQVVYLENLSTPQEWITSALASAGERKEYFSLALIRRSATRPKPELSVCGQVCVVGLGPGDPDLLSRRALQLIRGADAIVGYEGYLRLLKPLRLSAELHCSPIGEETTRARQALELARAGRRVALVSSGDAGIYG